MATAEPAANLRKICWKPRWPTRGFRPPTAGFARNLFMASSAGRPRSTGSSRAKPAGREQRPALQNLLRLGLYQIFWLDRIPAARRRPRDRRTCQARRLRPASRIHQRHSARLFARSRRDQKTARRLENLPARRSAGRIPNGSWNAGESNFGDEKDARNCSNGTTRRRKLLRASTRLKTDAGKLVRKSWREENVEYDFVRARLDWTKIWSLS